MRHYEVVFLVHPDQSDQVKDMVERYRGLVERGAGKVHRLEDWGRRPLAYSIAKLHKAHYVLMNIELDQETLKELESAFRFNDAVLRSLIIRRKGPVTGHSKIYQDELKEREKERGREARRAEASREGRGGRGRDERKPQSDRGSQPSKGEEGDAAPDDADEAAPGKGDEAPDDAGEAAPAKGDTAPDDADEATPAKGDATSAKGDAAPDDAGKADPDKGDAQAAEPADNTPDEAKKPKE